MLALNVLRNKPGLNNFEAFTPARLAKAVSGASIKGRLLPINR